MGFWDGSGISWTIYKQSAPRSRQTTTPTTHHSIFTDRMLSLTPIQQCQSIDGSSTEGGNYTEIKNTERKRTTVTYLSVVHKVLNAAVEAAPSDIRWVRDVVVRPAAELKRGTDAEVASFTWCLTHSLTGTAVFCWRLCSVALCDGGGVAAVDDQPHLLQRHSHRQASETWHAMWYDAGNEHSGRYPA